MNRLRITMAQIDFVVGRIEGNRERILEVIKNAQNHHVDLVIFPELCLTGYPPEDLLLRKDFLDRVDLALEAIALATQGITVIVGFPERKGGQLFNSAAILQNGRKVQT